MSLPKPVTRIRNRRTHDLGTLVRIGPTGEPVVRYFGDTLEYPCSWAAVEVLSSTEYTVPVGDAFHVGLWVTATGDVYRRTVVVADRLCVGGDDHSWEHGEFRTWCTWCGEHSDTFERFHLVAAQSVPAVTPRAQTRHEIERYSGSVLARAGSAQAYAIRPEVADEPVPTWRQRLVVLFLLLCVSLLGWWLFVWAL